MSTYDRLRELEFVVEDVSLAWREAPTTSGFDRVTTIVSLHGDGETGRGEDVTYETAHHESLHDRGAWDLTSEYTIESFSETVASLDLFAEPLDRAAFQQYRHWALESAALDLALKQADTTLGTVLDRDPVDPNFVVSTSLSDDPDRVHKLLDAAPVIEFKLDPTDDWTDDLIADLAATGAVRVLDMKDQYPDSDFTDQNSVALYRTLIDAFPDAIIEDPTLGPETSELVESVSHRVSWDAPIHALEDLRGLPWKPDWLNVKPSRFGSLETLFETLDYAIANDINLYGGGQFELDVGRSHIQELAALYYPDAANDIAPGIYNEPGVPDDPPTPPLEIPTDRTGFGWTERFN